MKKKELIDLLDSISMDVEILCSVEMNDETVVFPLEDVSGEADGVCFLLCGEELKDFF
jgi:hypothetical protein